MTTQIHSQNQPKRRGKFLAIFTILLISSLLLIVIGCNSTSLTTPVPSNSQQIEPTLDQTPDLPPGFPTPDPEEYNACIAQGGRWEILGFSGAGCNPPTTDSGRSCVDGDDCEGSCLGDNPELIKQTTSGIPVPDLQRMEQLNSQEDEIFGSCSQWRYTYSCHIFVEDGKYTLICVD